MHIPSKLTGREEMRVPRYQNGQWQDITETVTCEEPCKISWKQRGVVAAASTTLWAWPRDLCQLALGHVFLEKMNDTNDMSRQAAVERLGDNEYMVSIGPPLLERPPVPPEVLDAGLLLEAMAAFITAQGNWDDTGCFHRAGVYDPHKKCILTRAEDIGRHNCLDRLAGWAILNRVPLTDKVLLVSARMTASLCAKALRAGFRVLVSRSAVTGAAVAMANESNATLVGFARCGQGGSEKRFTVFSDRPERIQAWKHQE